MKKLMLLRQELTRYVAYESCKVSRSGKIVKISCNHERFSSCNDIHNSTKSTGHTLSCLTQQSRLSKSGLANDLVRSGIILTDLNSQD